MKKTLLIAGLLLGMFLGGFGQTINILPKDYLFKVDPASALFHEFRCTIEKRWPLNRTERIRKRKELITGRYWFLSPAGLHRSSLFSPWNQRQFGGVLRMGVRHYFLGKYTHQGVFLQTGGVFRLRRISFLDDQLVRENAITVGSFGATASAGYQKAYSPKKNIIFALSGGVEYLLSKYPEGFGYGSFHRGWYQMPFLDELRVFISFEVGFAFRQKARHW